MIHIGFTGDTSSSSIVPVSFSLTIDTDVIIEHIIMRMSPMTPGTKLYADFMAGLYIRCTDGANEPVPSCPESPAEISVCSLCSTPMT